MDLLELGELGCGQGVTILNRLKLFQIRRQLASITKGIERICLLPDLLSTLRIRRNTLHNSILLRDFDAILHPNH